MWRVLRKKSLYLVCRAVIRAGRLRANLGVAMLGIGPGCSTRGQSEGIIAGKAADFF